MDRTKPEKVPISILIPAFNEEANIRFAIESALWADEIIVLDCFSTDRTLEICKGYESVRVVQHKWEGYAKQWNWALENIEFKNEWLFMMAADEMMTTKLARKIAAEINDFDCDGYLVRMRYMFFGKWVKHAAGYPQWTIRLFKHKLTRYEEREVNEHPVVRGKVCSLYSDIIHHDRKPLWFYINRHNRYSDMEARERYAAWKKGKEPEFKGKLFGTRAERVRFVKQKIWKYVPLKPFAYFLWLYFFKLGFLDGRIGLYFCIFKAIQEFHISVKMRELQMQDRKAREQ